LGKSRKREENRPDLCLNNRNNVYIQEVFIMSKKTSLVLMLAVLFAFTLSAQEINVTGEWEMTSHSPRGERTSTIKFVQEGEKLTVIMEGFRGGERTSEGTVKGNKIEWTVSRSTPRGDMVSTYTGIVDGDIIKGEVSRGERGSSEWTAKKK
jgi:hypothetical protein